MKRKTTYRLLIYFTTCLFVVQFTHAQTVHYKQSNGLVQIKNGAHLHVGGNAEFDENADLDNQGTFGLSGDLMNNSTHDSLRIYGFRNVEFTGVLQEVNGSEVSKMNVAVIKNGGTVDVFQNMVILDSLYLNSGIVIVNSGSSVKMKNNDPGALAYVMQLGSIETTDSSSYFVWNMNTDTDYEVPMSYMGSVVKPVKVRTSLSDSIGFALLNPTKTINTPEFTDNYNTEYYHRFYTSQSGHVFSLIKDEEYRAVGNTNNKTLSKTIDEQVIADTITFPALNGEYDYIMYEPKVECFVPTAFAPGSGGEDDTWFIRWLASEKELVELVIYDRFGNLVLDKDRFGGNNFTWDGTDAGGNDMPTGVYPFFIKFDSKCNSNIEGSEDGKLSGDILLVREK